MADYARRDPIRAERARLEQQRRLRTRRPRDGAAPALSWNMEGQITFSRRFGPALIAIDPLGEGYVAEWKRVIGVDAYLELGEVEVYWRHNTDIFVPTYTVSGGTNRIAFDGLAGRPEPFIIENGDFGGEYIQPVIAAEPEFDAFELTCYLLTETVSL